jgi:hypothetical protein
MSRVVSRSTPSKSLRRDLNGCTKSNSTAFAWPRASTTAACNSSLGPASTGPANIPARSWLADIKAQTAYLDGELCGVDDAGLPSFAHTQAATDGERDVRLVYCAFDLLHLEGSDVSGLPLIERKALLEPLVTGEPSVQFNGHEAGDGELILKHAGKLGFFKLSSQRRSTRVTRLERPTRDSAPSSMSSSPWSLSATSGRWRAIRSARSQVARRRSTNTVTSQ